MADPDEYHRQQQRHLLRVLPESWQSTHETGSSVLQTLSGNPPHTDNSLHGGAEYRADSFSKKRQRAPSREIDRNRKRIMASSGNFSLVCRVCSKEFPSGRALGDHMRVHGGLHAEPIRATERRDRDRKELGKVFLIENCNSVEQDRDSGFEEGRWSESGSQRSKVLLEKILEGDYEESFMEEEEEEEDAEGEDEGGFEVAVPVSSETGYDDEELLCDDQFRMISSSHSKKPRFGSVKFISNLEAQQNREILGVGSSKGKRRSNLRYQLRHNPKRSRISTDQGFERLENLAGNAAMSARRLSFSSPGRARVCCCRVCGKDFGSPKALFGHMRCHPEREWRGIQPPETTSEPRGGAIRFVMKKLQAVGSFDEESEIELQSDLENCKEAATAAEDDEGKPQVRFKIKWPSRTHNTEEPLKQEGERSLHSAMGEFTVKNWTPTAPQPTGKRSKRRRPSDSDQQTSSTPETVLTSETTSMDIKEELKTYDEIDLACCLLLLSAGQTEAGPAFLDSARAQKDSERAGFEPEDFDQLDAYDKRDARNLTIASTSDVKYECRTCKKCFNSPQALGGHRASHKKMKECYVRYKVPIASGCEDNTEDHLELNERQLGAPLHVVKYEGKAITGREEKKKNSKIKGSHECSICHRIFPTGQALGGHKRRHWIGEKTPDHTASVASTNNDRQLSLSLVGGEQTEMLEDEGKGIDLNLPAPLDEEEDEAGYHHGVGEEKGDSLVEIANRSNSNSDGMLSPVNWRVKDFFGDYGDASSAEMFRRDGLWGQHQSPQLLTIQFL